MKEIKGKVISYCEIPENLLDEFAPWLNEYHNGCYVEVHIDLTDERNLFDQWLIDNYPGIEDETFYIEIDY